MKFLLYGEDTYRSKKTLASMRERFLESRDPSGMNIAEFVHGTDGVEEVLAAMHASPFLAERKLVIIKGYLRATATVQKKLAEHLDGIPESTNAIFFEEGGVDDLKKSPLFEILREEKFTVEHQPLSERELLQQVKAMFEESGVAIEPAALAELVRGVGPSLPSFANEARKLCAHAHAKGRKAVTLDDVATLCADGSEAPIFAMIDACVRGNGGEALALLERSWDDGVAEAQVTSLLIRQYRALAALADSGAVDAPLLASSLGMSPYALRKLMPLARAQDPLSFLDKMRALIAIERKLKSGHKDARAMLTAFILGASLKRPRA